MTRRPAWMDDPETVREAEAEERDRRHQEWEDEAARPDTFYSDLWEPGRP